MPVSRLKMFLDQHKVKYVAMVHSAAYTAQEIAQTTHIPGKDMAKTVMVNVDGKLAMAVLPANCQVDFDKLKSVIGSDAVDLASEQEFKEEFPECETGAMPPFGNLYEMAVYMDQALTQNGEIAFNAGTHTEVMKLAFSDYQELVKPTVGDFSA